MFLFIDFLFLKDVCFCIWGAKKKKKSEKDICGMKLSRDRACGIWDIMWFYSKTHVAVSTKNRKHEMFKSHNPYYLLSDDTGGYILRDWFLWLLCSQGEFSQSNVANACLWFVLQMSA